jgi:hypothetical protein
MTPNKTLHYEKPALNLMGGTSQTYCNRGSGATLLGAGDAFMCYQGLDLAGLNPQVCANTGIGNAAGQLGSYLKICGMGGETNSRCLIAGNSPRNTQIMDSSCGGGSGPH